MFRCMICAVVLLGAAPGAAQPVDPQSEEAAKRHNQLGLEYVDQGQFGKACEEFRKAYEANPKPSYLFNIARALEMTDRVRDAVAHYERYAKLATSMENREQALQLAERARKRLASLTVAASPEGALVEVDGESALCRAGVACLLDPGSHVVQVSGPGLVTETRKVELKEGESRTETVLLERVRTVLSVEASEQGALVYLDGTLVGASPLRRDVEPGSHVVKVEREGFVTQEKQLEAQEGRTTDLNFFLVKEALPAERVTRWGVLWRSLVFPGLGQFHADWDRSGIALVVAEGLALAGTVVGFSLQYYYEQQRAGTKGDEWEGWDSYARTAGWVGTGAAWGAAAVWACSAIHAASLTLPEPRPGAAGFGPGLLPGGAAVYLGVSF